MILNCGEDSCESLGLQGDPSSPYWRRPVLGFHWKDWCWGWNSNTLATWCEELTHWKRPWRWERLKVGGEGDDRGWDGRMASPTRWTWVWVNSGSWWWTGRPGVLQSMEPQRVRHDWVTELSWISFLKYKSPTVPRDTLTLFFIHLPVILLLNYSNMTGELITWNLRNADENGEAQLEPLLNILITICLLFTLTLNGYNLLFPWFKSP